MTTQCQSSSTPYLRTLTVQTDLIDTVTAQHPRVPSSPRNADMRAAMNRGFFPTSPRSIIPSADTR